MDAHIPEKYIASERLRLEVYRKLASSQDNKDLRLVVEEMEDRYGPIPEEVERLLAVSRLRHQARRAGVTDIMVQGTRIKVGPVELPDSKQVRLKRTHPGANYRAAAKAIQLPFPKAGRGNVTDPKLRDVELLQWLADFLSEMFDVEAVDVSGARSRQTPQSNEKSAAPGAKKSRSKKRSGQKPAGKTTGSVFSLSE